MLTLFDVDVTKRSEQRMRLAKDYTDALMRVIDQPLVVLDSDMRVQTASEYFARALGKTAGAIVGQHLSELEGAWSFTELQERIRGSAATSSPFERVPIVGEGEDSSRRTVWVTGRCCRGTNPPTHRCGCSPFQRRTRPRRVMKRK